MSHELRTPLNAIIGFTGTLLMGCPARSTRIRTSSCARCRRARSTCSSLINDLLDLAKIEAGKIELAREPVDCREVVEEVAATLRPQAEKKGLALTVGAADGRAQRRTDRRALSQIVINLVQQRDQVHRARRRSRECQGTYRSDGTAVAIRVEDTGLGIRRRGPGEAVRRVLRGSTDCAPAAGRHRARAAPQPETGRRPGRDGSRSRASTARGARSRSSLPEALSVSARILIVEDNPASLELARYLLDAQRATRRRARPTAAAGWRSRSARARTSSSATCRCR